MLRYIGLRLALFVPTLLIASIVIFAILRVLPGDVVDVVLGGSGEVAHDPIQVQRVRQELGLDEPVVAQYGSWLWSMATGDFGGRSFVNRAPISSLVARQLPVTLQLAVYTMVLAAMVAIPVGIVGAVRQGRWTDFFVRLFAIGGQAVPSFFLALLALIALVLLFGWSPPVIYDNVWQNPLRHAQLMIWPVLILAWGYAAYLTRMTRAGMLDVLGQDYIRTARSKGLAERIVLVRHALRNALIPVLSVAGIQVGALLGGAVVMETIFGLPGIGRGIIDAVSDRDYPVVQTYATLFVFIMLSVNLVIDVLYAVLDPRITYGD